MMISAGILRIFSNHNRQLIPISPNDPHKLKRPLHDGWQNRQYTHDEIQDYVNQGLNLGWRLEDTDMVIDVDPRNGGLESLSILLADFQKTDPTIEDLGDLFPAVRTGGGGYHYYCKVPGGFRTKNDILRYGKGIEFKTVGRQVVIPGSLHPSGNHYEFDDFSDYTGPAPMLPDWLLDLIEKPDLKPQNNVDSEITTEQLAELLSHLPAQEFNTNDTWFDILCAAHEGTQGQGLKEFLDWSLSDPEYADRGEIIKSRWHSLGTGKYGNITVQTLYKEVVDRGGKLPPVSTENLSMYGFTGPLPPSNQPLIEGPPVQLIVDKSKLETDIENLTPHTPSEQISSILERVATVDILDQDRFLSLLKRQTGRPARILKDALKKASKNNEAKEIEDTVNNIVLQLVRHKKEKGSPLIHASDQRFWEYNKTHWSPIGDNVVGRMVHDSVIHYRTNNPHISTPLVTLTAQGKEVLKVKLASRKNLHEPTNKKLSIINVQNCELKVDSKTGNVIADVHRPDSYLISCLPVVFDPKAKCPEFSKALEGMFTFYDDKHEIIRHLWEIIGYTIQPQKDLATWVLFKGEGANGKTVVLDVITALLGKACANTPIDELDTKRNNHAFAGLPGMLAVIDEDMDVKTVLPDAALKKLSESKTLTANPKGRDIFTFRNTAIPLFASNVWPKSKDLSNGLRRRALVFDFNRTFHVDEQITGLSQYVIDNELAGVLVNALKGFQRLRQRGKWEVPTSCEAAKRNWLNDSNILYEFVDEVLQRTKEAKTLLKDLYNVFDAWSLNNGYTQRITKPTFRKSLESLGFKVKRGSGNQLFVVDVAIEKTDFNLM